MNDVNKFGEGIFDLEQEIGRGGAATVWKAVELDEPHRQVAVKLVTYTEQEFAEKGVSIRDLFAREARTWAEFQRSAYVVQLYRTFEQRVRSSEGIQYALGFVMEHSPEGDLRRAIRENRLDLNRQALTQLLLDIAKGLKEGHDRDIIHRDIKASNVLLFKAIPNRICPKLMDFGLSISTSSIDGRLVGTPEYMAPEVFDNPQAAPKASDVYSLGVLFYEIIMGRLPFLFNVVNKLERLNAYRDAHQFQEIKAEDLRRKCGKQMAQLICQMLQKKPTERLQLNSVIAYLERFQLTEIAETLKTTPTEIQNKEGKYLWHPLLHTSLGEILGYFVISGTSLRGDPTWFINNLEAKGFRGFSIYTILGGYDYILRIWYPRDAQDNLEKVLRDFRDFHNGSYLRFNAHNMPLLRGKSAAKSIVKCPDLITEITKCFNADEKVELQQLRQRGFVVGTIAQNDPDSKKLRFFLTLNAGARTGSFLISAYATEFARSLQETKEASSVSVYEGEGDFQILIKFRLKKFEDFNKVFDRFLTTKALIQRNDSLITMRTFIEFGDLVANKSDDGTIMAEAAKIL